MMWHLSSVYYRIRTKLLGCLSYATGREVIFNIHLPFDTDESRSMVRLWLIGFRFCFRFGIKFGMSQCPVKRAGMWREGAVELIHKVFFSTVKAFIPPHEGSFENLIASADESNSDTDTVKFNGVVFCSKFFYKFLLTIVPHHYTYNSCNMVCKSIIWYSSSLIILARTAVTARS